MLVTPFRRTSVTCRLMVSSNGWEVLGWGPCIRPAAIGLAEYVVCRGSSKSKRLRCARNSKQRPRRRY